MASVELSGQLSTRTDRNNTSSAVFSNHCFNKAVAMSADSEERENELLALHSIFTSEEFVRGESKSAGEIRVFAELPEGFTVSIKEGMKILLFLFVTFELNT